MPIAPPVLVKFSDSGYGALHALNASVSAGTTFTWVVGDVFVVKCMDEGLASHGATWSTRLPTNTGSGLSWTLQQSHNSVGTDCGAAVYTAVATAASSGTISIAAHASDATSVAWGIGVEQYRNSLGVGASAVTGTPSATQTTSMTTQRSNSAVSWCVSDFSGTSLGSPFVGNATNLTASSYTATNPGPTATPDNASTVGHYMDYCALLIDVGGRGGSGYTFNVGCTGGSPTTGPYTIVAVEILGTYAPGPPIMPASIFLAQFGLPEEFFAMPVPVKYASVAGTRFWVGNGATPNWNDIGNWSLTSGGVSGAAVPTTSDDIVFDENAPSPNVLFNTNANCHSLTVTNGYRGQWANNGTNKLTVGGGSGLTSNATLTLGTGMTFGNMSGFTLFFDKRGSAGSTLNMTSNGIAVPFPAVDTAVTSQQKYVFLDSWNFSAMTAGFKVEAGTMKVSVGTTLNIAGTINVPTGSTHTIDYTGATIIVQDATILLGSLSWTGDNSSLLKITADNPSTVFTSGTFPGVVEFSGNGSNASFGSFGTNTFTELKISGHGVFALPTGQTITTLRAIASDGTITYDSVTGHCPLASVLVLQANQTVTNFIAQGFNQASRITVAAVLPTSLAANTGPNQFTITAGSLAGNVSLQNVDFADIVGAGGSSGWTSGTNVGNMGNCSGITFTTPVPNLYWFGGSGNYSDPTHWGTASNGGGTTGVNVPLPQDTAVFDRNSFSANNQTVTMDGPNFAAIDASDVVKTGIALVMPAEYRTNSWPTHITHGNITLSSGVTMGGYTFIRNRDAVSAIVNTNGGQFNDAAATGADLAGIQSLCFGGTMELGGDFLGNGDLSYRYGAFKQNSHNITAAEVRSGLASAGGVWDGVLTLSGLYIDTEFQSGLDDCSKLDIIVPTVPATNSINLGVPIRSLTVTNGSSQTLSVSKNVLNPLLVANAGTVVYGGLGTLNMAGALGADTNAKSITFTDQTTSAKTLLTNNTTVSDFTRAAGNFTVQTNANKTAQLGWLYYTPAGSTFTKSPGAGGFIFYTDDVEAKTPPPPIELWLGMGDPSLGAALLVPPIPPYRTFAQSPGVAVSVSVSTPVCSVGKPITVAVVGAILMARTLSTVRSVAVATGTLLTRALSTTRSVGATVAPLMARSLGLPRTVAVATAVNMQRLLGLIKSVAASVATSAAESRTFAKVLTVAVTVAMSITRALGRTLSTAVAATLSVQRALTRTAISVAVAVTPVVVRSIIRTFTVAVATTVSAAFVHIFLKTLTVAVSVATSLQRGVLKLVSVAVTAAPTVTLQRALLRTLSVAVTVGLSVVRALTRSISVAVSVTVSAVFIHVFLKVLTVAVTVALSMQRTIQKPLLAAVAVTTSLVRQVGKILSVAVAVTVSAVEGGAQFFKSFAVAVTVSPVVVRAVQLTKTVASTVGVVLNRSIQTARSVAVGVGITLNRALRLHESVTVAVTTTVSKLRSLALSVAVAVSTSATFLHVFLKSLSVAVTTSPVVVRSVGAIKSVAVTVGPVVQRLLSLSRTITLAVAATPALTRRYAITFAVAVTTTISRIVARVKILTVAVHVAVSKSQTTIVAVIAIALKRPLMAVAVNAKRAVTALNWRRAATPVNPQREATAVHPTNRTIGQNPSREANQSE